jgi:predicted helicase
METSCSRRGSYVYGVLHAPAYRERFANDLSKALPRIPTVPEFGAFAEAGRDLAALHLGYETCAEYPLEILATQLGELQSHHFRLAERAMRFADDDRAVLIINDHVRLAGIPPDAHAYVVNGRTPLEWFIDRYRVTRDRESGIVNDPNGWFSKPEELVSAIRRIVYVSVETARTVAGLPTPFAEPYGDQRTTTRT